MRIELFSTDGSALTVKGIREFNFSQAVNAACDSLWVTFSGDVPLGEIVSVRAYEGSVLIFSGICDCQKSTADSNGYENYIYARSGVSLLVDNEAEPFTYERPTARQLCFSNAEKFGFKSRLPDICCDTKYEVLKGTSCFGAISNFVSLLTGGYIYASPENEIMLRKYSDDVKPLNKYSVLKAVHTINRSEPYSQIIFKKGYFESGYRLHTRSAFADEIGIDRSVYLNLSSLPQWQRENAVIQRLRSSFEDYKVLEVTICGYCNEELLQRFSYFNGIERFDDYALTEKRYYCDRTGEYTRLTLKKYVDIKEITYVD